jgi:hypothetical protein
VCNERALGKRHVSAKGVVGRGLWEAGMRPITRMVLTTVGWTGRMTDLDIRPQPAPRACEDRRALAQRALACELSGELELAVALIRRLQHPLPRGRRFTRYGPGVRAA